MIHDELKQSWTDLFSDAVDNDDADDELFDVIVLALYDLVVEHFPKISIVEGLHYFKSQIPRKKEAIASPTE